MPLLTPADSSASPGPRIGRRLTVAGLVLAAGFLLYRAVAVYTVRVGECERLGGGEAGEGRAGAWITGATGAPGSGLAAGRDPGAAPPRPLRVVSYNVHGRAAFRQREHVAQVAETIRRLEADVVGLQEVHRGTWQARGTDQAAELARLTGLAAGFGPSFEVAGGEYGNALLTRGEILWARVLHLPSVGEPRSVLAARIALDGRELTVLVTHLAAWGPLRRSIRLDQIDCLVETVRTSPPPVVLLGDLNAGPGSPELVRLTGGDALRGCAGDGTPTYRRSGGRIDHVLCGAGLAPLAARVERIGPSDHWPLVAELGWRDPGPRPAL